MLASSTTVQLRHIVKRKQRPFTTYEAFTNFHDTASNSNDKVTSKNTFKIFDMPPRNVDKKFVSCSNLVAVKNNQNNSLKNNHNDSLKNIPAMKRTLSIRRPKSLQRLTDELKPLLDAASSLSSIGSYNELTEESVIDSSDDSRSKEINNVVLRKGGKLRSLKHRPRSSVLVDRNLGSIPENILAHNLRKRHGIHAQSLNNISNNSTVNGLESILMDIDIEDKDLKTHDRTSRDRKRNIKKFNKSMNQEITNNNNNNNNNIPSKCVSLQNIAIPRRRSKGNALSEAVSTASISEQSFSKEQKKRLKKKMKDTKKSPENSVFLGLF